MRYDFKGQVIVQRERCLKDDGFGVYTASVSQISETSDQLQEKLPLEVGSKVTVKGDTAKLTLDAEYYLTATLVQHPKYGYQLEVVSMARTVESDLNSLDHYSKKKILHNLFTDKQVEEMYKAYDDPYSVLMEGDYKKLVKIKGCGTAMAVSWTERFNAFIPTTKIFLELAQYDLTPVTVQKLLKHYKSAEAAIRAITSNPYILCDLEGIGWVKADKAALASGIAPDSIYRVEAYVRYDLQQWESRNGHSFITVDQLFEDIKTNLGSEVANFTISEAIQNMSDQLYWDENKIVIGLRQYWELENQLADEILRLLDTPPLKFNTDTSRIQAIIQRDEQEQGWNYTEEQLEGLKTVLENNFVIITGSAGTGKSSLVKLILSVLGDQNYNIAQTALSGRAAARLSEVTHREGSTIHRLLGYPKGDKGHQLFEFNQDKKLPLDIVVVDEISMIGGYLFYYLLRALKTGTKVILLGDVGQLEAIGECNVAYDLLACGHIPTVVLTQIQRQALQSAIVTESNKVRRGIQLIPHNASGFCVRGELQDLAIDCYSDKNNTFIKTVNYFKKCLGADPDILNTQVLSPVRVKGDASVYQLNLALQEIYNPLDGRQEITVKGPDNESYGIRVGDKVINIHNNYKVPLAYDEEENVVAVYNGNIGIVLEIFPDDEMAVIDFQEIGVVLMDEEALSSVILAYATTIHKYQGSECNNVIVALDNSAYTMLSRELVYTAITRAKQTCILVCQNNALRTAIATSSTGKKQTYLAGIIKSRLAPKKDTFNF